MPPPHDAPRRKNEYAPGTRMSQEQLGPNASSPGTAGPHRVRVLIVDDMQHVREQLRLLLELTGEVEVVGEAANGLEALGQAQTLRPEVVILDLEMPGGDGFQAAQQIKEHHLADRVIILSVHATAADITRAREEGADAFVEKGASLERLLASLRA